MTAWVTIRLAAIFSVMGWFTCWAFSSMIRKKGQWAIIWARIWTRSAELAKPSRAAPRPKKPAPGDARGPA